MGLINDVLEVVRRAVTGDRWYVEQGVYVLELRAPVTAAAITVIPINYLVLPLGLQSYSVKRVMRQSITPTLGGLVAEEQGELWKEISVSWDPGLQAKRSIDTSTRPERNPFVFGLSGPAWSQRVLRNYFDAYAQLKSDPEFAAATHLIWHDMKADDHWLVVPTTATVDRMIGKRMRYPLSWEFTTLGDASSILPVGVGGALAVLGAVLGGISDAIAAVNKGVSLISAAIQEVTGILAEVRLFYAKIDSILTQVQIVTVAAQDFLDGVTDVLNIGRDFVADLAATLDALSGSLEDEDIPDSVRQTFMQMADGLDTIAAQREAYGDSYSTVAGRRESGELGNLGRASNAELAEAEAQDPAQSAAAYNTKALPVGARALADAGALPEARVFARYGSFVAYTIKKTDTLTSIAADKLGSGALWYDIAIINRLKAPYISTVALPDVAQPGDTIKIPVVSASTASEKVEQDDSIYLTDMAWTETPTSKLGAPRVTLAVDERTLTDVKTVGGIANLSQALWLRSMTERGALTLAPDYGMRRMLGLKLLPRADAVIKLAIRENLSADPRVQVVERVTLEQPQTDQIELHVDVVPIGDTAAQQIKTILL